MLLCAVVLLSNSALAQSTFRDRETYVSYGVVLGTAIAVTISWSRNRSVLFAIVHGLLSWIYIVYYLIVRDTSES